MTTRSAAAASGATRSEPERTPDAPAHLSERAAELWTAVNVTRRLSAEGSALVLVALEALSRADEARGLVARESMVITTEKTGMPHAHPALKIEKDALAGFARAWALFGFHRVAPFVRTADTVPSADAVLASVRRMRAS